MEAGGCTEPAEDNMGPDAFYVEEAQATLAHLQDIGISNLADHWIANNPGLGLQVAIPEIPIKRKTDFLGKYKYFKYLDFLTINGDFKRLGVTSRYGGRPK